MFSIGGKTIPPVSKDASLTFTMTETVLFGGQCPPYIEIVFNTKKDRIL
ncbi:MAG: hypothetical protein ACUBOA_11375 [Candidatus Loosdrechtia sp.]|nr:MAG: hypothetical protein QY305_00180 [Candidatus Jettenia sp. AMX2]